MHNVAAPAGDITALLSQIGERLTALPGRQRFGRRLRIADCRSRNRVEGDQGSRSRGQPEGGGIDAIKQASLIHAADADSGKQVSDYIAALAAFTQTFPDDPPLPNFKRCGMRRHVYAGICTWQNMAAQWKVLNPSDLNDATNGRANVRSFSRSMPSRRRPRSCNSMRPLRRPCSVAKATA